MASCSRLRARNGAIHCSHSEAFGQIATCYRRLNKPREARGAVQQAKAVLERIKPDVSFAEASIYSRREWTELLEWLSKL